MRKVMHKIFFAWNYEKEENWINSICSEGFKLVDVGFCRYVFEAAEEPYIVRCEMLDGSTGKSQNYINFVTETGAECVGKICRWVYFTRPASMGEFELFSDLDSKIKHYNKMILMCSMLLLTDTCSFINIFNLNKDRLGRDSMALLMVLCILLAVMIIVFGLMSSLIRRYRLVKERRIHE